MADGRDYGASIILMLLFSVLRLQSVLAETYTVGGALGWSSVFADSSWPDGKNFTTNDTLVFNYIPGTHNVIVVNEIAYSSCNPLLGSEEVYTSGADRILLSQGMSYFIDGIYCLYGLRMALNAS